MLVSEPIQTRLSDVSQSVNCLQKKYYFLTSTETTDLFDEEKRERSKQK